MAGAGMTGGDGYLSRDRAYLARMQRQRRARMVRIDYMPTGDALAAIGAKRATLQPGSAAATNSAVLDTIVMEWAELTGINNPELASSMTSVRGPELSDRSAQARMTSDPLQDSLLRRIAKAKPMPPARRAPCGAKRHRDGQPCQALSEPGKKRCRFHGGRSTGPRTPEGKAKAQANLRRGRVR